MSMALGACCSQLAATGLAVAFPNTTAYNLTSAAYWSLQEATLTPSCIVTPHNSQEAAETISVLVASQPWQSEAFAIKGNGHSPAAGFANIDFGVTIDTTSLTSIILSKDHSVVTVGAGASWLDVYAYFSPQVGFTCDKVVNFEVVLASGKLVNANATCHPDLFRALKGGANNFGLVTAFSFSTIPYTKILGDSIVYSTNHSAQVFDAFSNIAAARNYDVHASIVMALVFNSTSKTWALSSTPAYTLPEERPAVYNELFAVPNITDTVHIANLSTFANETATPPLNWLFYTGTYGVSAALLTRMFNICNATLHDFQIPHGVSWALAFEPLPTVFVSHGAGSNALGTSTRDGNSMILLVSPLWVDSASNGLVHAKAAELVAKLDAAVKEMGTLKRLVYGNYADWSQKPLHSYGETNVELFRQTARKYDPTGVFQKKVPGGFKLFV